MSSDWTGSAVSLGMYGAFSNRSVVSLRRYGVFSARERGLFCNVWRLFRLVGAAVCCRRLSPFLP
eukprot:3753165-Pyramimonas_sp.AAC.1